MKLCLCLSIASCLFVSISLGGSTMNSCEDKEPDLLVYGIIKEFETQRPLVDAKAIFKDEHGKRWVVDCNEEGRFKVFLPLDRLYTMKAKAAGYYSKRIIIDTHGISEADKKGGFSMNPDFSLLQKMFLFNASLLKKPLGRAYYRPEAGNIEFDMMEMQVIKPEIDAMNERYLSRRNKQR